MYLAASHLTGPLFAGWQRKALRVGKEDPARTAERWGKTKTMRPDGPLVWFHAASVGETQSILPLIDALLAARADVQVLITSTTRTSAQMLATGLPRRVIHQMAPYDTARASRAFLDHWRPDVAIWIESELWPRMLSEVGNRGIPRLLLNARVSGRTARSWRRFAKTANSILSQFDIIQVQEVATLQALAAVGVRGDHVTQTGSLKQDRPPLQTDPTELETLRKAIGARPVWCASSTHASEEEIVLTAHMDIGGLLILVPRHVERAAQILELCAASGLRVAQRSLGQPITARTDVYLADTMGELGLWYRLAPVSLICGSLQPVGGHNPYEAAQLDTVILHGEHVGNFAEVYAQLDAAGGSGCVQDVASLVAWMRALDDGRQADMRRAATAVVQNGAGATSQALAVILARLT